MTVEELIVRFQEAQLYVTFLDTIVRDRDAYFLRVGIPAIGALEARVAVVPTPFTREIAQSILVWLTTGVITEPVSVFLPNALLRMQSTIEHLERVAVMLERRNLLTLTSAATPNVPREALYRFGLGTSLTLLDLDILSLRGRIPYQQGFNPLNARNNPNVADRS